MTQPDFFERQDQARRHTKRLVAYFIAGVALLILAIYLVVLLLFVGVGSRHRHAERYGGYEAPSPVSALWHPQLFFGVALSTLAVVTMGSLFKTAELARGGSAVASLLGGRLVDPSSTHADERKLLNVVEEMAIASGVPVPQVFVLAGEKGINAFAAGHSPSDAAIAVTEGCLEQLTRDELQGVIGHEFSHLLNGDMRLNLRLMGIIFGILCLAVIGRILLSTRSSRDSRDRNPLPLLGLALLAIGWIGVLFGRLMQAAVSRQREFLADASAVQFTRNPAGLVGALKKIGGLSHGSRLESAHAEEASHMFFSNGMGEPFLGLMETHPPLAERIRALDPTFDGTFPAVEEAPFHAEALSRTPAPPRPSEASRPAMPLPPVIRPATALPGLGTPTPAHLRYAEELREAIPDRLRAAAHEGLGASTLVYAMLLSQESGVRARQLAELASLASPAISQETVRLWPTVQSVATRAKLPLLDLSLPGLRHLSPAQYQQFRRAVQVLVESDGEIDLFEYVLQKVVLRHLEPHYLPARPPVQQYYALKPLLGDCATLLSALARVGQQTEEGIAFAFRQGAEALGYAAGAGLELAPAGACELEQVDAALNRLVLAVPQIKKNVLNACVQTVGADGVIQEREAELLRAIAEALDCPMPPFL